MGNHSKTDADLGRKVNEYLKKQGVHTPMADNAMHMPDDDKIAIIEEHTRQIWSTLGLDMTDDSLVETPRRIAKMMVLETMWGLKDEYFPKCTTVDNKMGYNQMVTEKNVTVMSLCEHHGVVIDGVAHVSYIPKNKVLGLSKINRIVEYFSRRPQIQERLTEQVGQALQFILETDDVAVSIDAVHYCVKSRGVRDYNSSTVTTFLGGGYAKPEQRKEFYDAIRM